VVNHNTADIRQKAKRERPANDNFNNNHQTVSSTMDSTNKSNDKGQHDNYQASTHPNILQNNEGKSKETAVDLELDFEGEFVHQEMAVMDDTKDTKEHLKPSKKQLMEWTHLVKKGMLYPVHTVKQQQVLRQQSCSLFQCL
jgi:hypothetical protein